MQKIIPCLWFNKNGEEATQFYASIFKNTKIGKILKYDAESAQASGMPKGSVLTVNFTIDGQEFLALNGGPQFPFTPAISFFVYCKTEQEIDALFEQISKKGKILMPLDKYPFSEKYAFLMDQFGVSWQLILSPAEKYISPSFLFVGKDLGKAEAAMQMYTTIFKNAKINHIAKYEEGEPGQVGTVKHASFSLEGQEFIAMDGAGPHAFTFNESVSFIINCKDQEEVDYFWNKLTKDGQEVQCGWLKDKFGISWQVVPTVLEVLLQDKDPKKAQRVMQAMLQMVKIDIQKLEEAYNKL